MRCWVSGLQPGDRVLDLQPNQNSSIEMDLACCTAGLVRVVLNYRLHPDDWARIADDCGAVGMVYDAPVRRTERRRSVTASVPQRVVAIGDGPGLSYETLIADASGTMPSVERRPDDLVSLNYTSGTTGRPKGVRRTHRNRWSCLVGMTYDVLSAVPSERDTYLHAGPITHTSGLFVLPFIAGGGTPADPWLVRRGGSCRRGRRTAESPTPRWCRPWSRACWPWIRNR